MAAVVQHIEVKGVEIPVVIEVDNKLPILSLQLIFQSSGHIEDTKAGLAKLSAKMMNEGSIKRGAIGFANALEDKAIHLSAHTGSETFVIELDTLMEQKEGALKLFKELLQEPNLTKESLQKVKSATIGSITRKQSDYDYVANNLLKSILFKGTPLQAPSNGTKESIESIALEEVKGFIAGHLDLSNLIVVVGGDIDQEKIKEDIAALIDSLKVGTKRELLHVKVNEKATNTIEKRNTKQAYIYFGSPYNMRYNDKELYKAKVATFILGSSGFGSRLMEEIRVKRGLAYSAYARVNFSKSSNYFMGYLQTKLESMQEAKETVLEVIETFVKEGVTQEELDQAKRFLLGSEPLRVETLSQRLSRTFMEYYQHKPLGSSKEELEKIEGLKLDELNAFIGTHKEILHPSFAIITE